MQAFDKEPRAPAVRFSLQVNMREITLGGIFRRGAWMQGLFFVSLASELSAVLYYVVRVALEGCLGVSGRGLRFDCVRVCCIDICVLDEFH